MNPIQWIRWKMLLVLGAITGGLAYFGIGPVAKTAINHLGTTSHVAQWSVQDLAFNPVAGRLTFGGLAVDNVRQDPAVDAAFAARQEQGAEPAGVLAAQSLSFDLDMVELLRRRYCGQMHLQAPQLRIERRADGSLNIDFGETTPTDPDHPGDHAASLDWWAEIQKYVQKVQEWNEQYRKLADKIPQQKIERKAEEIAAQKKSRFRVDYSKRVAYPFEGRPRFIATSLTGEGMEITFVDNTPNGRARGAIPPLKNGRVQIENVSDSPATHAEPIRWTVTGEIAGAPIRLVGTLDERRGRSGGSQLAASHLQFDFQADGLPVEVAQFFVGDSLPLHFDRGTLTLAANATVNDWNELDVRPVFGFRDAAVSPQPGTRSIAGVSPDVFCCAFNEVSTVEINDLHITGTVAHPNVELGHTITNLVRSGGKAIAKKQIEKGVQMGTEKINQAVDKELGKLGTKGELPPEVGKTVDDVKRKLGDRLKGLPFGEKPGTTKK